MKTFFATLLFTTGVLTGSQLVANLNQYNQNQQYPAEQPPSSGRIQWYTNYNQALEVARQSNKPILLFFTGSDWCGWCKKMVQEVFSSPEFAKEVGQAFVFVEVDFPSKPLPPALKEQNEQLRRENGVTGYPTIIIKKFINNNLTFVAETGYQSGGGRAYAKYLNELLH